MGQGKATSILSNGSGRCLDFCCPTHPSLKSEQTKQKIHRLLHFIALRADKGFLVFYPWCHRPPTQPNLLVHILKSVELNGLSLSMLRTTKINWLANSRKIIETYVIFDFKMIHSTNYNTSGMCACIKGPSRRGPFLSLYRFLVLFLGVPGKIHSVIQHW